MCNYSMLAREWSTPNQPNFVPFTVTSPSPELAGQMLEVLRRLDEIDKKLGLLDCDDVAKDKIVKKLKKRANQKSRAHS